MICELLKFQTYRFKNKQLQFINLNITVTCKRKNKMNPSLLIIGSLALNFHHYNIQSNQKKYNQIRTINDLDLIVSSDFLDFYLANLKTSHPDWIVTLQDESPLKKSYLFKLPHNHLSIYIEFDIADKSGNSNDLALEYAKQCGYPSLSFEQYQEILDCLIENFAKNLIAERNLEGVNAIYRKLSKKYHVSFTNPDLERFKYTQIINPKNMDKLFTSCLQNKYFKYIVADLPLLHVIKSAHKYQKFEHFINKNGLNNSHKFEKTKADIMFINELLFDSLDLIDNDCNTTISKSDFVKYYIFECDDKRINRLSKSTYQLNYKEAKSILYKNLGLVVKHVKHNSKDGLQSVDKVYQSLCDFYQLREKESYTHKLPSLNVDKGDFFKKDEVNYIFDHDSIHEVVALFVKHQLESNLDKCLMSKLFTKEFLDEYYGCTVSVSGATSSSQNSLKQLPAYTKYMKDEADVMTDADKFFQQKFQTQILGVVEETMVLALERFCFQPHNQKLLKQQQHQLKLPKYAFEFCLKKVCTTITGGYFREFAYVYYFEALKVYHELNPIGNEFYLFVNEHLDMLRGF